MMHDARSVTHNKRALTWTGRGQEYNNPSPLCSHPKPSGHDPWEDPGAWAPLTPERKLTPVCHVSAVKFPWLSQALDLIDGFRSEMIPPHPGTHLSQVFNALARRATTGDVFTGSEHVLTGSEAGLTGSEAGLTGSEAVLTGSEVMYVNPKHTLWRVSGNSSQSINTIANVTFDYHNMPKVSFAFASPGLRAVCQNSPVSRTKRPQSAE